MHNIQARARSGNRLPSRSRSSSRPPQRSKRPCQPAQQWHRQKSSKDFVSFADRVLRAKNRKFVPAACPIFAKGRIVIGWESRKYLRAHLPHAVHQRAAPDISLPHRGREVRPVPRASVHKCTDAGTPRIRPILSQIVPREKAPSGRRVRSASCCIIMISDRDRAFSASQKASWDKCARMRPKMSPMFTISRRAIPAPATAVGYTRSERNGSPGTPTRDSRETAPTRDQRSHRGSECYPKTGVLEPCPFFSAVHRGLGDLRGEALGSTAEKWRQAQVQLHQLVPRSCRHFRQK